MNPEKIKKAYPECDKESRGGLLLPYGEDPTDDLDILPEGRNLGTGRESQSTVYYQTTGNPSPDIEQEDYKIGNGTTRIVL